MKKLFTNKLSHTTISTFYFLNLQNNLNTMEVVETAHEKNKEIDKRTFNNVNWKVSTENNSTLFVELSSVNNA